VTSSPLLTFLRPSHCTILVCPPFHYTMYEAGRGFLSSLLPFTSSSPSLTSIPPLPQFPSAPPRQQRKPTELRQLLRALSLTHDRSDSEDSEEEDDDSEEEGGEDVNEEEVDSEVDEARVDESEEEEEMMRADADEDELLSLVRSRIEKKKNGAKLLEAFDEKWREMQEVERKQGWSRERTRLHEHRFVPGAPRLLPNCTTPVDFFHQLLPVAFIDAMVEPGAHQHVCSRTTPAAQGERWEYCRSECCGGGATAG
jgi:hypothetical protein